ncbi:MAG: hypothetical protein B7X51_09140 [Pseudomonas sp. 34-62-33]|nr:MAG: hypothetical protein B7X51_09140 [Pseudomonas sp. 34-62-33]
MKTRRNLIAATALMALLAGCTTNPYTGESQAGKAGIYGGIGAATGAVIGAATSSKKDRTKGALIGAAVGGAAGGGYGYYVDTQEAKLRQTLQGTGVQVQRNGDDLKLIMPGNITFASNSADISSSFYPTLNSLVLVFKEFNKNGVNIVGHTDNTGSGQRISVYGAGPSQPIASNASEAGRAQNRRVEINLRPL